MWVAAGVCSSIAPRRRGRRSTTWAWSWITTKAAGPRDALQAKPLRAKAPGVEFPDNLPMNKAQRFYLDPEQIAIWEEEERRKQAR